MDQSEQITCAGCAQTRPAEAGSLVAGPLAYGDRRARPCAERCRRRVEQAGRRR
ncbi:MAG: hypothetical protein ACRDYX_23450 [Egibacteraceae bacterium]